MNSAAENADGIRQTLATTAPSAMGNVVVESERHQSVKSVPFIDINTNEMMPMEIIVNDAWRSSATLERPTPHAYLILPGNDKAIENLRTLGVEVRTLTAEKTIDVEAYRIESYRKGAYPYEGVRLQEVEASVSNISKAFPEGTYIVEVEQARGHLLGELLEPEAGSGFVHMEVIPTSLGAELPVYRYLNPEEL